MACNCKNGQTFLNSCIPVAGGTAEDSTYMIDMTHYTCGNRKICVNGFYPPVANLNYQVVGTPQAIGNDVYVCDILITGQVTWSQAILPAYFALENMGVEPSEIRRRVDEALKTVGMYEYRLHAPHKLSGGQKQRVAIAGIIAMRPDWARGRIAEAAASIIREYL